ncbi:MAG TPA: EAL domain-containing protein [Cellvibrionaceae bacterium]
MTTPPKLTTSSSTELRRRAVAKLKNQTKNNKAVSSEESVKRMLYELQVHKIELEMQNEELQQTRITERLYYRYTELFEFAPIAYFAFDLQGTISQVNLRGASLLGVERANLVGTLFSTYVTTQYRDIFKRCLAKAFEGSSVEFCEIEVQAGERTLWLSVEANLGVTGTDCLTAMTDITDRKKAEEIQKIAYEEKEKRANELALAASVFAHAGEAITITDAAGTILDVNDTFTKTTGYSRDEVIGNNSRILQSGKQSPEFYAEMWQALQQKGYWYGEIWNRRKNGELYAEIKTISAIRDANDVITHYVSLCTDITLIKEHQDQLERMVNYDILTNLPNRSLLADRLSQAMFQCNYHSQSLAVLFLDLDGFKNINDDYGHNVGDELLVVISRRMQEAFRDGDTLARIGGDEFVAVLTSLDKLEDCEPILERILLAVSAPVVLGGAVLKVTASIGVTLYPQDSADADQLVRHADQAMYVAKESGKNRYHLFDTAQDDAIKEQRKNLAAIRIALDKRQFLLYYQPKVNMRTGRVTGIEALIRWQHPERGLLNPIAFLPVIENHANNIEMGEWVIDTALTQISQWQAMGLDSSVVVSVNISAVQLQQPDFAERLAILLAAHPDVEPRYLELEVLETSALNDVQNVSEIMKACVKLGINFALDDFGTGYSSLTHLRRFPARVIKIDQSFVRDMLVDVDDLAIVDGVIGLAKSFKREVIAEGVETIEHGTALLQLGCELAQGYGIARPMPATDVLPWINDWKPDVSWQG